jgi:WD40 repeat protein
MKSLCKTICFAAVIGLLALAGIAPVNGDEWAFSGVMPGGHRGPVNALVFKGNLILSAGEDGFLEIWDIRGAQERFQLSPYSITAMAERPGKDEICLIESDGLGLYRISAWNFKERRNIFSVRLRDPLDSVSYSMGGNFIIAARSGGFSGRAGLSGEAGLIFIDPASGDILQSPSSLAGTVSLAVTGRTERNMMVYSASGVLSYWALDSGSETSRFAVLPNLHSPALFSNSRYLAGINAEGLAVINAVSGELVARDNSVPGGSLLYAAGDEFICLVQKEGTGVSGNAVTEIYRYAVDRGGRLARTGHFSLSASGISKRFTAIAASGGGSKASIALGTGDGNVVLASINGQPRILAVKEQTRITEAAVSGQSIAFIAENGTVGFISQDYNQYFSNRAIRVEQNREGYNRITALGDESGPGGRFIFWQDGNTRIQPVIWSSGSGGKKEALNGVTFRTPIRSADSLGGKILFLDSMGNITVIPAAGTGKAFTFFSVGIMDAAFVDNSRIIIGRSAVSGNTPFMMINTNNGETVPLPYPCQVGVALYRGASGNIYAAEVSAANGAEGMRTSVLHINQTNAAGSEKLFDFQGEETQFSLVESVNGIASTIGGEGAALYTAAGLHNLDRTAGFAHKLIDGGPRLISLDRDGNICWHDSQNGKLLAVFRLHPGGWTLQTAQRTLSGNITE